MGARAAAGSGEPRAVGPSLVCWAEPGDNPLTIDLASTICEIYCLAKAGAQRHNYAGVRGYHPLLGIAAGTGDVLMARLRKGRAKTTRGAANFLRETVSRVLYAGATGQLTVRAGRGFYSRDIVSVCRDKSIRFSITVRQHRSLRHRIKAIPEEDWIPIPYWMEGAEDVAETTYIPFQNERDAAPVRLIVRRVKPTHGSQLALFSTYSYHASITDRDGDTLGLEADHSRHAEVENAIRDLKDSVGSFISPRYAFPLTPPGGRTGDGSQPGLLHWTYRSGRTIVHHQDPAATLLLPGRTHHPLRPPAHDAPSPRLALAKPVRQGPGAAARPAAPILTAPTASVRPPHYPIASRICSKPIPKCPLPQCACRSRPSPTPRQVKKLLHAADTLSARTNPSMSMLPCLSPSLPTHASTAGSFPSAGLG